MFCFGCISTVLDILCFLILWFILGFNTVEKATLFQTGWFAFGIVSQTFIIQMIRTDKKPFIESKASKQLLISSFVITLITSLIVFTNISNIFDLTKLPPVYILWIIALLIIYAIAIQICKRFNRQVDM